MGKEDTIMRVLRAGTLIGRYYGGTINADEEKELMEWLAASERNKALFNLFADENTRNQALIEIQTHQPETVLTGLLEQWEKKSNYKKERRASLFRWAATITVLVTIALGILILSIHKEKAKGKTRPVVVNHDVRPGLQRATLVLANGGEMSLLASTDTTIVNQGMPVAKQSNGLLSYNAIPYRHTPMAFNTLYTPKGGEYHLQLADGTNVWLNASSSIRFPTTFTGRERKVEVSGEVFFDVVQMSGKPFVVVAAGTEIVVLGTSFNVTAYPDEMGVYTTLVNGAVKIKTQGRQATLKPGYVAISKPANIAIQQANVAAATAWKDGLFIFDEVDISTLMKEVSRWYDVSIEYAPGYKQRGHFTGKISRNVPLSELLNMISLTAIAKFKIEDRKIVVFN